MSALVAFVVVCALALAPAAHHCNQRCRRQLAEQCAKDILAGRNCPDAITRRRPRT